MARSIPATAATSPSRSSSQAPAQLNARAYNSSTGEWSALTSTFFSINSTPATAANLVISEIHYHPAEPATPGEIAISTDRDDYEFIEFLNIGAQPIDLTGVYFSTGINFAFAPNTLLDPGARAVLVRNPAAFAERYGAASRSPANSPAGSATMASRLTLSLTGVGDLHDLTYNDQSPWPTLPDGGGYSLVLRDPRPIPTTALPRSWGTHRGRRRAGRGGHASRRVDTRRGRPRTTFIDDAQTTMATTSPPSSNTRSGHRPRAPAITPSRCRGSPVRWGGSYLTISYEKNPEATDIIFQLQSSTDLAAGRTRPRSRSRRTPTAPARRWRRCPPIPPARDQPLTTTGSQIAEHPPGIAGS